MGDKKIIGIIKEWASPFLLLAIIKILWTDLAEMKSDIKILLGQSKIYETEIENLKNEVNIIKTKVYASSYTKIKLPSIIAIRNEEEQLSIKNEENL